MSSWSVWSLLAPALRNRMSSVRCAVEPRLVLSEPAERGARPASLIDAYNAFNHI
jgi:hypothetical protein